MLNSQLVSEKIPAASEYLHPTDDFRTEIPEAALTVLDLSKSFRSGFFRQHSRGITGVSFSVQPGTIFGLLGHNGSGKTTTINCILDLVHPDGGEVRIMGKSHRCRESRARVGYLPERPYFFEHLSGRELLQFYGELLGLTSSLLTTRITEVLASTGMAAHANLRLKKFSKGMLQRIGLAQTLLGDPDLLILDEPMSGLDPMGRRDVRELLLKLRTQGKTIIFSSHIVADVEAIADDIGILRDGHLVTTRALSDFGDASVYQVHMATAQADRLPGWAQQNLAGGGSAATTTGLTVVTEDVGQLRELLTFCYESDIHVRAVDTRRTALEDFFIATNECPQEVVA